MRKIPNKTFKKRGRWRKGTLREGWSGAECGIQDQVWGKTGEMARWPWKWMKICMWLVWGCREHLQDRTETCDKGGARINGDDLSCDSQYWGYRTWTGHFLYPDRNSSGVIETPIHPQNLKLKIYPIYRLVMQAQGREQRLSEWLTNNQPNLRPIPWPNTNP